MLGKIAAASAVSIALIPSALGQIAPSPNRTVLPIPPAPFRGTINTFYADSTASPTPNITAPAGAPNILLILLDDAGYGQTSTFGGLIPTPTLDRLANNGLRYTRFHVTAMCSPTRAALLTGRNPHAVGMGVISNWSSDFPGYTGSIPRSAAFVSEILEENGYATAAIGKWHLTPDAETTPAGPFDHWPTREGFDYYYGFLAAETDQWYPELTEGTAPLEMIAPPDRKADYTLNEDLADKAIRWIQTEKSLAPQKPFFMYYATGGTHAPLQAPQAWIDKFKGQFDIGWDRYREMVLERQKKLGVVPSDTQLTARPDDLPAWDSLSSDQKKAYARMMEVFAGYMAQTDHEIGRVIDAIQAARQLDNTLIFYIAGDNGASLEGNITGTVNFMAQNNGIQESTADMLADLQAMGGPTTTPAYPAGWAWAGDTPFQWGKRIGSHLGGTRDPLVISWPARIEQTGGVRNQFQDVIDIFPTILEAAGVPEPTIVNGTKQQPVDGLSMMYTFSSAKATDRRTTQYFEMLGNRAIYRDGWIAALRTGVPPWGYVGKLDPGKQSWELYHITNDYSEAYNLATQYPEKLQALQSVFLNEARKYQVLPIDTRLMRRHPNPGPTNGADRFTYYSGMAHLFYPEGPAIENRSHTITAYVDIPAGGANGVLVSQGGESGGFSLFLKDGKPAYTYNYFKREVTTIIADKALPPGPATIILKFDYDGGERGKGATATLLVNAKTAGTAHLTQTVPSAFSFQETFDVGEDSASPVGDYESPFPFTGALQRVEIQLGLENPSAVQTNAHSNLAAARD